MTKHSTLNVKLSNSQLNKLKSGTKNRIQVTLNFHQMWLVNLMMRLTFRINYY